MISQSYALNYYDLYTLGIKNVINYFIYNKHFLRNDIVKLKFKLLWFLYTLEMSLFANITSFFRNF
jgi:hypothetical protein